MFILAFLAVKFPGNGSPSSHQMATVDVQQLQLPTTDGSLNLPECIPTQTNQAVLPPGAPFDKIQRGKSSLQRKNNISSEIAASHLLFSMWKALCARAIY